MAQYARLGPLDPSVTAGEDFIFDFQLNRDGITRLAPNTVRRSYSTVYVPVPVALTEHSPEEWKATNPAEIQIEFQIIGAGQRQIDGELRKLRKFIRKDKRTGEPPDLLYVMGRKQLAVRLHRMEVTPILWNQDSEEQRVKVSLTMHTIKIED